MENKLFKKLTFIDKALNLRVLEKEDSTIPMIFWYSLRFSIFFSAIIIPMISVYFIHNTHRSFLMLPLVYIGIFCLCFQILMYINFSEYTNENLKTTINLNTDKIYKNEKSNKMITSKSGIKRNNENEYLKEREKIEGLKNQIKSFQKPIIKIKVILKP